MKNVILALFLVFLLIGCTQPQITEKQEEQILEEEQLEENQIDLETQQLMNKAEKIKSYSYNYKSNIPGERQSDKFYVKMPYVKVELNENVDLEGNRITVVYLDTSKETAIAYCKDKNQMTCPDRERVHYVNYNNYYKTLPHEWLINIDSGKKTGYESIERKDASVIEIKKGKKEYTAKIIDFYGIPAIIQIDDKEHKYTDLAFNHLLDEDVMV